MSDSEDEIEYKNEYKNEYKDIRKKLTDKHFFDYKYKTILTEFQHNINNLTSVDFNNFITRATTSKTKSFISSYDNRGYNYGRNNEDRKKIIKCMFNKFTPDDKQFKLLCSCYGKSMSNSCCYHWIDVLIDRNYKFTAEQKTMINEINYVGFNVLIKDKELDLDIVKYYINKINDRSYKNYDCYEEFNKIIQGTKTKLPMEYIQYVLINTKYKSDHDFTELVNQLLYNTELDDSIFDTVIQKGIQDKKILVELIKNIKPTDAFINYLGENKLLNRNLEILFGLMVDHDYKVTNKLLNLLLSNDKYCYIKNINKNIDLSKINITFDQIMFYNIKETKGNSKKKPGKVQKISKSKGKQKIDSDEDKEVEDIDYDEEEEEAEAAESDIMSEKDKYEENDSEEYSEEYQPDETTSIQKLRTIMLYDLFKIIPTIETLEVTCLRGYTDEFKVLTEKYKIIPDKNCLNNSVKKVLNLDIINQIICYKINPDKITFECLLNNNLIDDLDDDTDDDEGKSNLETVVELFVKCGLQLTMDDMEKLIRKGLYLKNLDRFGIAYDDKLYFICFKNKYKISEEDISKFAIDKKILKLRKLCLSSKPKLTVQKFKQYLIKNNIKPDRYCLDNAIICRNNNLEKYMLIELKCLPTIFSLCNTSSIYLNYKLNRYELLDNFNVTAEYMSNPYDHIDLTKL